MAEVKPVGKFAKAAYDSILLAEALQGMAVAKISEDYAAVRDEALTMQNLTWDKFVTDLTDANENGTMDELNQTLLANIIQPMIEQVLAQSQEQGAQ
jgi:flagellar biosynthesis regulator FlaF